MLECFGVLSAATERTIVNVECANRNATAAAYPTARQAESHAKGAAGYRRRVYEQTALNTGQFTGNRWTTLSEPPTQVPAVTTRLTLS